VDINELRLLKKGWNGVIDTPAPNKVSIDNAELLVNLSMDDGIEVGYIQPSHNGGVNLIYIGDMKTIVTDQKWVKVECDNDGDIGVLLSDGNIWFILKEFITINESIKRIKEWLKG